ncbi:hypothetical protein PFICI_13026 [Pestalotiopsis fici W106-1]|uniref:rRNA methyltransferase 1, mitochondrial n=1 Tax=Pestalotiopsis fici (strain W106-1 / CGMCC3.15140) TaxID=1229662 RepID=W3WMZ7_PESFW|nr:uncharacterized protein PFICI_13026 [Pestalotiopsis fici W106-1]ETS74542.1 hypothetical protein PFICI_13026 [Pestalotiopsis fici W106-1]
MRTFNSLCFVHRHTVLFKTSAFTSANHVPVRYSSLSAIHRGLRNSEKSRPQGFTRGALESAKSTRAKRPPSRVRRDPDWTPTGFKIKKGKRDITDQGPQPKSRSGRFNDPTESFGKKSLVYQVKHGRLREQLDALGGKAPKVSSHDSFESKFASKFGDDFAEAKSSRKDDFRRSSSSRPKAVDPRLDYKNERSGKPFPRKDGATGGRSPGFARLGDRSTGRFSDNGSRRQDDRSTGRFADNVSRRQDDRSTGRFADNGSRREDDRPPRTFESRSTSFSDRRNDDASPQRSGSARDDLPIRIHYTTAASQFLYGRSVVEAALRASRRKLYHLYLYAGRDRQNLVQDATLEKLANQLDVPVTKILDNDGLRMMDKMSGGRPHNGCVLEASPTPQVPLKSLGGLSEDTSNRSFKVELAYQSAEDAAINGSPEEIQYHAKGNRKPFFLLLDGILDPGNLGAILRTAAFLGVTGVVISKHGSSGLTPVSLKASSGASEVLQLYSTASTLDFIERSKDNGWMVYASVAAGPRSRGNAHLTIDKIETYDPLSEQPTILVIGSEGEGLEKKIKRLADFEVSIPGQSGLLSTIDSLNVSVATGIMCSAFLKKSHSFEIEETVDNIKEKEGETTLW